MTDRREMDFRRMFDHGAKLTLARDLQAPHVVHQLLRALVLWGCQPENERSVVVDGDDQAWLLDPPRGELAAVAGVTERTVRRWFRALRDGWVSVPYLSADWHTCERHAFLVRWDVIRDLLGRQHRAAASVPRDTASVSPGTECPPGGGHPVRVPRDTLSPDRGGHCVPRDHKPTNQDPRSITTTTNQPSKAARPDSLKGLGVSIRPEHFRRAEGWWAIWRAACLQGFPGCDPDSREQRLQLFRFLAWLRRQPAAEIRSKPGFLVAALNAGPGQWSMRAEPQDHEPAEECDRIGTGQGLDQAAEAAAAGRAI